jgi:hypothetical protein
MTKRKDIPQGPEPLEAYAKHFDESFSRRSQRESFRQYLQGLLLPSERNKRLPGLANTEPLVGAQLASGLSVRKRRKDQSYQRTEAEIMNEVTLEALVSFLKRRF